VIEFETLPPTAVIVSGYGPRGTFDATVTVMVAMTVPDLPNVSGEGLNVAVMPSVDGDAALRDTAEPNPFTDAMMTSDVPDAPVATLIEAGDDTKAKSGAVVEDVKYSAVSDRAFAAVIVTVWTLLVTLSFHRSKKWPP
jgi:hypothetical protein